MNIIFIGFMGSGKTTIGKLLAKNSDMSFEDTDEMIEKLERRSISDIFEEDGEEYFRRLETRVIKDISENTDNTIISVGGGLPVKEENREYIKKAGTTVYLRASSETLCARLNTDTTRPLLKGGDLKEKIEALMEKRAEIYEDVSDVIIDTDGFSPLEIVEYIKAKILHL